MLRPLAAALLLFAASIAGAIEPLRMYSLPEPVAIPVVKFETPGRALAAQEFELAHYRFLIWAHHELPAKVQAIDADIALIQEELQSFRRRQAEFSRFAKWSGGSDPLFEIRENVRLAVISLEQRLALAQAERGRLLQLQPVLYRQREIELERAWMNLQLAR